MNGGYGRMLYNDKLGIRAYEYSQGSCLFAVVSLCEETALTNNKKSVDMLGSIFDIFENTTNVCLQSNNCLHTNVVGEKLYLKIYR
jgi:hypothetical protein